MAEIINEWPTIKRTRTSKYPWVEWLDGQKRQLVQGVDYETTNVSMQAQVGSAAKRLGVQYRTTTTEHGIAVQAILDWHSSVNEEDDILVEKTETGWIPRND